AVALECDPALAWMPDLRGRLQRAARGRFVERLADFPRPLHLARGGLQVAPRQVDADAVPPDAIERARGLDVAPAAHERDHELDLVLKVLGQRWIRHGRAVGHDRVGWLGEEKRWIAHVVTHFADVLFVVAADAPDAADRKQLAGTGNGDRRLRRRRNDVARGAHVHAPEITGIV